MVSRIELTGLKGEATLSGHHLARVAFQLSAVPGSEWCSTFMALAKELAQKQNHGLRPGFRYSYRLEADSIQVSCPAAAFTTPVNGQNAVAQTIIELVANANRCASGVQTGASAASEAPQIRA